MTVIVFYVQEQCDCRKEGSHIAEQGEKRRKTKSGTHKTKKAPRRRPKVNATKVIDLFTVVFRAISTIGLIVSFANSYITQ